MKNTFRMSRLVLGMLSLAFLSASQLSAESPTIKVGSTAPPLELQAADGTRHSLATVGGPTVLIFYRGLW